MKTVGYKINITELRWGAEPDAKIREIILPPISAADLHIRLSEFLLLVRNDYKKSKKEI